MKQTRHPRRLVMYLVLPAILTVVGCSDTPDYRDQRLADFAQQSMTEQRKQNDRMADQAQAVVAESHALAVTAKELVERDAEARRELIAAQSELNSQINGQHSAIFAGHEQLEQDRRQIANHRNRDPIIAAVIQNFGLVIACLLPLVVAIFVLRQMQSQEPDHAAVAELLALEFTSDQPLLLANSSLRNAALKHDHEDESQLALIAGASTDEVEPPT